MIINSLKILMEEHNVNQSQISEKTGITRPTLLSLIRNENKSIRYDVIEKICKFFNVYMENFLIYSPIDVKIKDFNISLDDSDKTHVNLNLTSNVVINNKNFEFAHQITNINNSFSKYDINMIAYMEKEDYIFFVENNVTSMLNILNKLNPHYNEIIKKIKNSLNGYELNFLSNVQIFYNFKQIPEEDNFDSLLNKIDKLGSLEKDLIVRHLSNK